MDLYCPQNLFCRLCFTSVNRYSVNRHGILEFGQGQSISVRLKRNQIERHILSWLETLQLLLRVFVRRRVVHGDITKSVGAWTVLLSTEEDVFKYILYYSCAIVAVLSVFLAVLRPFSNK